MRGRGPLGYWFSTLATSTPRNPKALDGDQDVGETATLPPSLCNEDALLHRLHPRRLPCRSADLPRLALSVQLPRRLCRLYSRHWRDRDGIDHIPVDSRAPDSARC